MLDQLCNAWSVDGSNNLWFSWTMARTTPSTRKGPGGMICLRQLATRDARLPSVERLRAPTVITAADVERNGACALACTAAAAILRSISDPVDGEVLKGAFGQAFTALY